jgi:pimeloyl-ACP methyl ester carboxylesterase
MITSITTPTLIIQGALDRLVSLDAVRAVARARPDWTLEVYDDVGHVPQLEAPDRFAASVLGWLEGAGKAAAVAAR